MSDEAKKSAAQPKTTGATKSDAAAAAPGKPAADKSASAKPGSGNPAGGDAAATTAKSGSEGSAGTWKKISLVLFIVAGLAAVAAVDFAGRVSDAEKEMARLKTQVNQERLALKAEQDKFLKESADIAEAVAKKKEELAAMQAEIDKRRTESQELEAKLSGLYTETKAALDAASQAAQKHAQAQAELDKVNKERERIAGKIKSGREELSALEKDADTVMKGLKETIAKLKGTLEKL